MVYADRFVPEDEKARARETGDEPEAIPFLKRFTLFNLDQCESLPEDLAAAVPPPPPENLILPHAEALIWATGADLRPRFDPPQSRASLKAADWVGNARAITRGLKRPRTGTTTRHAFRSWAT